MVYRPFHGVLEGKINQNVMFWLSTVCMKTLRVRSTARNEILPKKAWQTNETKKVIQNTVKLVHNDHVGDEVSVVVIDRWSL